MQAPSANPPWPIIDSVYAEMLSSAPPDRRWLLAQTLATAQSRRALQQSLAISPGSRVLDVGCGFGASSLELAALRPLSVVGVDIDTSVLDVASAALAEVSARQALDPGSKVSFQAGDAYELPFDDGSQDVVFSRFVFQHLDSPGVGASELERVLRPGGLACVVDVDDGLSISEPPPSGAYLRLAGALRAAQSGVGGDRHIGRRLAGLLDFHGLAPTAVLVLPQAAYHTPAPGDPARQLLIERLNLARDSILAGGHMTGEDFEADLQEISTELPGPTCEIEAHLAVVAVKPAE